MTICQNLSLSGSLLIVIWIALIYRSEGVPVRTWRNIESLGNMTVTLVHDCPSCADIYQMVAIPNSNSLLVAMDTGGGSQTDSGLMLITGASRIQLVSRTIDDYIRAVAYDDRVSSFAFFGGTGKIFTIFPRSSASSSTLLGNGNQQYGQGTGSLCSPSEVESLAIRQEWVAGSPQVVLYGAAINADVIFQIWVSNVTLVTYAGASGFPASVDGPRRGAGRVRNPTQVVFGPNSDTLYFTQGGSAHCFRKIVNDNIVTIRIAGTTMQTGSALIHPVFPNVSFVVDTNDGLLLSRGSDPVMSVLIEARNTQQIYLQAWNSVFRKPYALAFNETDGAIFLGQQGSPAIVRLCCLWDTSSLKEIAPFPSIASTRVNVIWSSNVSLSQVSALQLVSLPTLNQLVFCPNPATGVILRLSLRRFSVSQLLVFTGVTAMTAHPTWSVIYLLRNNRTIHRVDANLANPAATSWLGSTLLTSIVESCIGSFARFGFAESFSNIYNQSFYFADTLNNAILNVNVDSPCLSIYACPSQATTVVDGYRMSTPTGCGGARSVKVSDSGILYFSDIYSNARKIQDGFVITLLRGLGPSPEVADQHPYYLESLWLSAKRSSGVLDGFYAAIRQTYFNGSSVLPGRVGSNDPLALMPPSNVIHDMYIPGLNETIGYANSTGDFYIFEQNATTERVVRVCCLWSTVSVSPYLAYRNLSSMNISIVRNVSVPLTFPASATSYWNMAYNGYRRSLYLFGPQGLRQEIPYLRTVLTSPIQQGTSAVWDELGLVLYFVSPGGLWGVDSNGINVSTASVGGGPYLVGNGTKSAFVAGRGLFGRFGSGSVARIGGILFIADTVNNGVLFFNTTGSVLGVFACDLSVTPGAAERDGPAQIAICTSLSSIQASWDRNSVFFSTTRGSVRKISFGYVSTLLSGVSANVAGVWLFSHPLDENILLTINASTVGVLYNGVYNVYFVRGSGTLSTPSGRLGIAPTILSAELIETDGSIMLLGSGFETSSLTAVQILRVCCLWTVQVETASATATATQSLSDSAATLSSSLTSTVSLTTTVSLTSTASLTLSQSLTTSSTLSTSAGAVSLSAGSQSLSATWTNSIASLTITLSVSRSLTASKRRSKTQSTVTSSLSLTVSDSSFHTWTWSATQGTSTQSYSTSLTFSNSMSRSASIPKTATVPPTRTKTFTDYPCRYAERVPRAMSMSQIPTLTTRENDIKLTDFVGNATLNFAAAWKTWVPFDEAIPSTVSTATLVRSAFDAAPNPEGFLIHSPNITFVRANETFFEITLKKAASDYRIDVNEELLIAVTPPYFSLCRPSNNIPLLRIKVIAQVDAIALATQQAVAVVTGTALTVSASTAGSAMDAQSIAVIALMSCAPPAGREAMKNNRLLSPLAIGDSYEAMVIGNIILLGGFALVHGVLVLAWIKLRKKPRMTSFAAFYFPGLSIGIMIMVYQGTAIGTMKIFTSPTASTASYAVAVIGLAQTALTPVFLILLYRMLVHASFVAYDWDNAPEGRRFPILRYFLPQGRWNPAEARKSFGPLFSALRLNHTFWTTIPLWSPTIMVIGAVFRPPTADQCQAEFATLAALQFLLVVFFLAVRPFRSTLANVGCALSNLCLGMILTGSAITAKDPQNATAKQLTFAFIQIQSAVTLGRIAYRLFTFILERTLLRAVPVSVEHSRIGTVDDKVIRGEVEKDDSDDDEDGGTEMLQTPLIKVDPSRPVASANANQAFVFSADLLGEDMEHVLQNAETEAQEKEHAHRPILTQSTRNGSDEIQVSNIDDLLPEVEDGTEDEDFLLGPADGRLAVQRRTEAEAMQELENLQPDDLDEDADLNQGPSLLAQLHQYSDSEPEEEYSFITARHSSRSIARRNPTLHQQPPNRQESVGSKKNEADLVMKEGELDIL